LSASGSTPFKRLVLALTVALGAIALLAMWLFSARGSPPRAPQPAAESIPAALPAQAQPPPPTQRQPGPPPAQDEHVAADGIGFMPLHEGDPRPPGPLHPHSITPAHRRIFAENRIAFALDDATDAKDIGEMKRLLEQYRRDFPEDRWQLQGGYAVILECLEHPGPESRGAAERWLDQNNGSTVKRSVLRDCLQPQP
jgi:hypothetical protein